MVEEEEFFVRESSGGDPASELILKHQDYLAALARQISRRLPPSIAYEELVAAGQVGLVEAARDFDPANGAAFTTFAYYKIRGAIFDELRRLGRWGAKVRREATRDAAANDVLEAAVTPSGADANQAAQALRQTIQRLATVFGLADADGADDPESTEEAPDRAADRREQRAALTKAFESLEPGYQAIIRMHYFEHRTMTQCAKDLGCDKATISRRHGQAIDSLRRLMQRAGPDE
ncbi:MAG: sigma-70 family RNA polymerase sigma factor [Phycisphaerales bacterium]